MGADFTVHLECQPKLTVGDDDAQEGSTRILAMLKARNRALAVGELQRKAGKDPRSGAITIVLMTPEGQKEQEVTYDQLMSSASELGTHAAACEGCPANFGGQAYGCFGFMNYPVTASFERWMVDRLQTHETPGGNMLLSAIRDFNYDGVRNQRMRAAGMFELTTPPNKVVQKKFFGSIKVNGDQLFQALFHVGSSLNPGHCMMVLTFLGALQIQGRVPATLADASLLETAMAATTPEQRRSIVRLVPEFEDTNTEPGRSLLIALYTAWVLDVPLLMDA